MILTEVSAPPLAAVPVRAFAEHLRLGSGFEDDGSQDAVLELYLRAAMAAIEARLGRALLARDFACTLDRWREDACQALPIAPVRSVAEVRLVDAEGVETVVEPAAWSVMRDSQRPRLVGRFGRSLPRHPAGGAGGDPLPRRIRRGLGRGAGRPQAGGLPAGGTFPREPGRGRGSRRVDAVRRAGADRGLPVHAHRRRAVMSGGVRLLRRLVLEAAERAADGSGGYAEEWRPLGTLWADVRPRGGREEFIAGRPPAAGEVPHPGADRAGGGALAAAGAAAAAGRGAGVPNP